MYRLRKGQEPSLMKSIQFYSYSDSLKPFQLSSSKEEGPLKVTFITPEYKGIIFAGGVAKMVSELAESLV